MDIINKDTYYNSIYQAIIVDSDINHDPEGKGRYQIYIPEVHYRYQKQYDLYKNESNKNQSEFATLFPWAVSLEADLKDGDEVYGSYINNVNNLFIILGKDARLQELGIGGAEGLNIGLESILEYAMPIIIENEVGINRNKWPDGITDAQFGNINSNDNGAWSIGLIQWHGPRAFDILYQIANNDKNWTSNWSDQSLTIVSDLQSAVKSQNASPKRNNWNVTMYNSSVITGTRNMLTSAIGKTTQIDFAKQETKVALDKLVSDPYNLSNPAIIIFLMDIMNQYGNGVNNVITGCIAEAVKINNTDKSMMEQLDDYRAYWRSKTKVSYNAIENGKVVKKYKEDTYAYDSRRTNTYNYLVALEKEGKLSALTFIDLTALEGLKYVPEYGEYFWPVPSSDSISCYWGEGEKKLTYSFDYNSGDRKYQGYSGGKAHNGLDITGSSGCPVIAVGSGEVVWVNGGGVSHSGSLPKNWNKDVDGPAQGNCIGIKMDKNNKHYFVYMHLKNPPTLKVGDKVKAGDTIGYMGSTGNSTGTHLHIGLHIGAVWPSPSNLSTKIDPLPYFGKKVAGMSLSSKSATGTADDIIAYAKTFLGNAYKWGGKEPPNFDCSGLTHWVYKHFGYEIGINTTAQRVTGKSVKKSELQPADLVHFSGHVGMYIGNNQFIHAPKTGDVVKITSLSDSYYVDHYWGATRILGYVDKK